MPPQRSVARWMSPISPLSRDHQEARDDDERETQSPDGDDDGVGLESRTSGPANEIPRTERARTQYGFADMQKKEPAR